MAEDTGLATRQRNQRRFTVGAATAWLIVLVYVASLVLNPWPDAIFRTDFAAFWTSGSLWSRAAGANLYDFEAERAFQVTQRQKLASAEAIRLASGHVLYVNPPPLALLFVPLALLSLPWAYILWSAISLLAFVAAVAIPLRGRPMARAEAALMLSFAAVGDTLLLGRVDGLFLLAFSLGLLALSAGRPVLGGALLGLLWLKPQYAALFPLLFLVKRRWGELAGMVATGLAVAGISLAMVGVDGIARYLEALRRLGSFYPPPAAVINVPIMVNWRAVLMDLWPGIPEATGSTLVLVLGVGTVLVSLLAWHGPWDPSSPRFARQMLVLALATIIASPHSHFNGAVLLLAPWAWIVARPMEPEQEWLHSVRPWVLGLGYLLGLAVWVLLDLRWLMVAYFLFLMILLTSQLRVHPARAGSEALERSVAMRTMPRVHPGSDAAPGVP